MSSNTVQKMLSPQEMALIDSISSSIEQLKAQSMMDEGPEEVEMGMMPADEMDKRYDEMDKRYVTRKEMEADPKNDMTMEKADMGPNANPETRAEDRVEDGTEITEGNYSEVGKALTGIAQSLAVLTKQQPAQPVRKSGATDATVTALNDITGVLKSLVDRQKEHDIAMANMFDVMGIQKVVEKSQPKQDPPVGDLSSSAVLAELNTVLKGLSKKEETQGWGAVQKSGHEHLRQALPHLLRS